MMRTHKIHSLTRSRMPGFPWEVPMDLLLVTCSCNSDNFEIFGGVLFSVTVRRSGASVLSALIVYNEDGIDMLEKR